MVRYRIILYIAISFALNACQLETVGSPIVSFSKPAPIITGSLKKSSSHRKAVSSLPTLKMEWLMENGMPNGSIGHSFLGSQSRWSTSLKNKRGKRVRFIASPVVSKGILYVLDDERVIHALDSASGKALWFIRLPTLSILNGQYPSHVSLAIGSSKTNGSLLYAVHENGTLMALDIRKRKWVWQRESMLGIGSHILPQKESLFFVDLKGVLRAVDPESGRDIWEGEQAHALLTTYAVYSDIALSEGKVTVVTSSGQLYQNIAQNGDLLWQVRLVSSAKPHLAVVADSIYVSGQSLSKYSAKSGYLVWQKKIQELGDFVVSGQSLFAVTKASVLEARDIGTGALLWRRALTLPDEAPIKYRHGLLLAAGRLHLVSDAGYVTSYYAEDGERVKTLRLTGAPSGKLIAVSGRAYVATQSGDVIAF